MMMLKALRNATYSIIPGCRQITIKYCVISHMFGAGDNRILMKIKLKHLNFPVKHRGCVVRTHF